MTCQLALGTERLDKYLGPYLIQIVCQRLHSWKEHVCPAMRQRKVGVGSTSACMLPGSRTRWGHPQTRGLARHGLTQDVCSLGENYSPWRASVDIQPWTKEGLVPTVPSQQAERSATAMARDALQTSLRITDGWRYGGFVQSLYIDSGLTDLSASA